MRWLPPMACIRIRSCSGKNRPRRRCQKSSQPDEGVWSGMRRRGKRDSTSSLGHSRSRSTGSKKTLDCPLEQRRPWVEPHHEWISVRRQGPWLGLNRPGLYDQPVEARLENLRLMRWLDEQYTRCPVYGVRRMTAWRRHQGHQVHVKRVRRWWHPMGWMAVDPKPRLSSPGAGAQWYPY